LVKRSFIVGLALSLAVSVLVADMSAQEFARALTVYRYRPEVFADQRLHVGLAETAPALQGYLWYIRMDESARALFGMEKIARFVQERQILGLDFSAHRTLADADIERLFQPDLWASVGPAYRFRLLKLGGTLVSDRSLVTVGKLMDLQVLELGDRITDAGMQFIQRLKNLRVLSLRGSSITDASLEGIAQFSRLERLDLRGTPVSDAGSGELALLPLRQLDLGERITDEGLHALRVVKTLEQLDLSQARVTRVGLSALSGIPGIHTLLLGASITDADLAALARFKNLKRLDLTAARISDQGADNLTQMVQLEELALSKTRVTDQTLQKLSRLPRLRYLELSDTPVTLAGFGKLGGFPSLQVLSFTAGRRLTVTDIRPLARLPQLHTLVINGVPLGRPIINYLKQKIEERSRLLEWLLPLAEAGGETEAQVDQVLEVATLPRERTRRPFEGFQGLKRIHEAESSLDEVIPAVTDIGRDTFQESEKNFLGEFEIKAGPPPKRKK
jgi:hypothetical protein